MLVCQSQLEFTMVITRFYQFNAFSEAKTKFICDDIKKIFNRVNKLETESCFHVETTTSQLSSDEQRKLLWILQRPQDAHKITNESHFTPNASQVLVDIGPRFNFSTAESTNSVSICHSIGLKSIVRIEVSVRYLITLDDGCRLSGADEATLVDHLGDRMTQCRYTDQNIPKLSFNERLPKTQESWYHIPVMSEGRKALEEVNRKLGLAFDAWDLDYYTNLFQNTLKRDPTNVEIFDCAQSNSEHSRHWFFRGRMIVDGVEEELSLIKMIINTQQHSNQNNTIAFSDNSSAIRGFTHQAIRPTKFTEPGEMIVTEVQSDLIFTAETHNMPSAIAPFPGATTGTGGRIRDVQGVGRGGHTIAGTAGYCVGNLNIPGYNMPYEDASYEYPPSFASPLKIIIEASNGASDYGNKFGEPLLSGFAISYGCTSADNERDEFVKPIMFSGGLGTMDAGQTAKQDPERGMLLAKIGGPVYRIGVGGGAASSVEVQGDNKNELDFNAVQRGDAEMENKLNRVVRVCIEMGEKNPIVAIHDQGAGGNGNVLKELVEPKFAGAVIFSKEFQLGDPTINALELWGAEYQENNAILCRAKDRQLLEAICARERCPISFVGVVTGNGFVTLIETNANFEKFLDRDAIDGSSSELRKQIPFDMNLKDVLGEIPRKVFDMRRIERSFKPLMLPTADNRYENFMNSVLSLLSVGSKRFLTNKVDRCVTGLIVQQQCVGPLHTPLADYALTLVSNFSLQGIATSIGTQPIKGLIDAAAGARMSVAEALSNLVFVGISELGDVKCSGNWMWAAKLPGEGAKLVDACKAMCGLMAKLGIAVDGGKDSLSMAARVKNETIKSPGTLVISTYAPCPDVRVRVTPDLKSPAMQRVGELIWINCSAGKLRLGGSALAQAFAQQGNDTPDIEDAQMLRRAFNVTQKLLKEGKLLAGHDISDGGLLTCLLEMAIGGMSGLSVDLAKAAAQCIDSSSLDKNLAMLFAEECGWIIEVSSEHLTQVMAALGDEKLSSCSFHIGQSRGFGMNSSISIKCGDEVLIETSTLAATKRWERTSFELEKLQMNPQCAIDENESYERRKGPSYRLAFDPQQTMRLFMQLESKQHRVAVIREEGVNSDREMIAGLLKAKFEVHDVTMSDLLARRTALDKFRGVIFPGGFSYADTLGSAKGWAASILFSELLKPQFESFKRRSDTFSLGICNGCQLMALIGWIGGEATDNQAEPPVALLHNKSGRFECRWSTVRVESSRAMMLRQMQGSVIGCWVAHGEGRFSFGDAQVLKNLRSAQSIALTYVDDSAQPTESYPMNPNGSVEGIAGICSTDGRHLALMPHPERCLETFQWAYVPHDFDQRGEEVSPWQAMFNEAYIWCCGE